MADVPLIMTVDETATIMRVSTRTVRRWLRAGVLRSIRRGRLVRVLRADFATALEAMRADPWGSAPAP